MSCNVLTSDRLDRLLHRTLDEASRAVLRTHFETPCEACLDRLASVDGEAILLALAGAAAELSPAEKDRIFAQAFAAAPVAPRPGFLDSVRAFFASPPGFALAAVAAMLIAVPFFLRPAPRAWDGMKGSGSAAQQIQLHAFAAAPDRAPRAVDPGGPVHPGERLFLRFTLARAGDVYLFAKSPEGAAQLLWKPEPGDAPWPPGEHELQQNGVALAVPLTASTELWSVATTERRLEALEGLSTLDERAIHELCAECAIARVGVELR